MLAIPEMPHSDPLHVRADIAAPCVERPWCSRAWIKSPYVREQRTGLTTKTRPGSQRTRTRTSFFSVTTFDLWHHTARPCAARCTGVAILPRHVLLAIYATSSARFDTRIISTYQGHSLRLRPARATRLCLLPDKWRRGTTTVSAEDVAKDATARRCGMSSPDLHKSFGFAAT